MSTVLRVSTHIYGVSKDIGGKMFIFQWKLGMWPLKSIVLEKQALLWEFQHTFMVLPRRYDGKMFLFRVNLGIWPWNQLSWKNEPCSKSSNTHLCSFQVDRWKNIHFSTKPRHVTPQINCLRKTSPVLMVSTHIYGVSKEIDGKTLIFQVNIGMWVLRVWTHIYGISQEIDVKMFIFQGNLGMCPFKSIILEKQALFWGFQHTLWGCKGDRWENIHF